MFYLKIFFRVTNKYNTTFIQFLLNFNIKKMGNIIICIYIYTHTKKTMLILNIFIYKSFYEKKIKSLQDIIVVQMYEI
jgi:hypothetical protein